MAATALVAVAAVIQQALAVLEQHVQLALKLRVQQRAEPIKVIIQPVPVTHVVAVVVQLDGLLIARAHASQTMFMQVGLVMVSAMMALTSQQITVAQNALQV